tara:strand:+ start:761 stop:1078 length:318 start_codon:yes stop_codon:yes gene_type:complete
MVTFTKRPGFEREEVTDINSIVYVDADGDAVGRVSLEGASVDSNGDLRISVIQDYPTDPTKTQSQFLARELKLVETLERILAEQRKTNFLLEQISGVDIDAEVFE